MQNHFDPNRNMHIEPEPEERASEEPVNPEDVETGAKLGGAGGALTGVIAGSMLGPVGALAGGIIGGLTGAAASAAAVTIVDKHDNDFGGNTQVTDLSDPNKAATPAPIMVDADRNATPPVLIVPPHEEWVQSGHAIDGSPDTRGVGEKVADAVTGDRVDDSTGKVVEGFTRTPEESAESTWDTPPQSNTNDTDTRGVGEKIADRVTGDRVDDRTGHVVDGSIGGDDTWDKTPRSGMHDMDADTRGIGEKIADGVTGDRVDDRTGNVVDGANRDKTWDSTPRSADLDLDDSDDDDRPLRPLDPDAPRR